MKLFAFQSIPAEVYQGPAVASSKARDLLVSRVAVPRHPHAAGAVLLQLHDEGVVPESIGQPYTLK